MVAEEKSFKLADAISLVMPVFLFAVGIYVFLTYGYGPEKMVGVGIWKSYRDLGYIVYLVVLIYGVLSKGLAKYLKSVVVGMILSTFSYALAGLFLDLINIVGYLTIKAPLVQMGR